MPLPPFALAGLPVPPRRPSLRPPVGALVPPWRQPHAPVVPVPPPLHRTHLAPCSARSQKYATKAEKGSKRFEKALGDACR
eukprot:7376708-Prymnesium_polylepis.1